MQKNKIVFYKNKKRGVALFIAIMVSGVVLAIGAGMVDIVSKEIRLSSIGRQSSEAFYAADTGLECALYYDDVLGGNTIFPKDNSGTPPNPTSFTCAGGSVAGITVSSGSVSASTTFTVNFSNSINDPCSIITVSKYQDLIGNDKTKINSVGLSSCNASKIRRSERGVSMIY